jgi:Lar family restriction alleviation protein
MNDETQALLPVTPELLPCPFCGEAGKWVRPMGDWTSNGYGPDRWRVSCSTPNCWAMTPATDTEAEAITAWNTRQSHSLPRDVGTAAINQNDAMRQELAHVGNKVSELSRAMGVEQANDDGSWPDLAGRIEKLIAAALTPSALSGDAGEGE